MFFFQWSQPIPIILKVLLSWLYYKKKKNAYPIFKYSNYCQRQESFLKDKLWLLPNFTINLYLQIINVPSAFYWLTPRRECSTHCCDCGFQCLWSLKTCFKKRILERNAWKTVSDIQAMKSLSVTEPWISAGWVLWAGRFCPKTSSLTIPSVDHLFSQPCQPGKRLPQTRPFIHTKSQSCLHLGFQLFYFFSKPTPKNVQLK